MAERKILVVDDEAHARLMLAQFLADLGEVLEARNGDEALDIVRAHRPHVVILDIQMPGKNGFQTLREMVEIPGTETCQVIILTAMSDLTGTHFTPEDVRTLSGRDPAAFFEKPIRMELLRETVACLLAT